MKYNLHINQLKALELGITNLNQAHIFDLLTTASSWASIQTINNEHFFWVSRQTICHELVLLKLKNDTIYRHLKSLDKIGLINYEKLGKKDCIKITKKGKKYLTNMSDLNPNHYVGNESEKHLNSEMNPRKLGNESEKHSDLNPTYHTTIINPITKHKIKKKISYSEKVKKFEPSKATANTFKKKYPHFEKNKDEYLKLLEQFKDQALNKKNQFIDLDAGMRTYIKYEYIRPIKIVRENEIGSFRDLGDTLRTEKKNNVGLPIQILI